MYIDYIIERLQREDKGNNKGYRGHTIVIQEKYFTNPYNIKDFCDKVKELSYVDFSNKNSKGIPTSQSYKELCLVVSKKVNYTLLKNIKPVAERMGLITR